MKTFISILSLVFACLFSHQNLYAQNEETPYVIVEYMKVKSGMWNEYRDCEKAWKLIHQERVKLGHITGWELEQVVYPSGTDSEYDFITITHFKNWKAIGELSNHFTEATWAKLNKGLTAEQIKIADNAEDYRDIVKREIWTGGDRVFAPGDKQYAYAVENFMRIPAGGWKAWDEMETQFVMPVHKKSVELGTRFGWMIGYLVLPRGADYPYQASTVDFYDSWEQMSQEEDKAWEAVYPDMTWDQIGERFEGTRTIARTEVRRLVDFVE